MNDLSQTIISEINKAGPVRFDRFWYMALAHPEHGYYMTRDPFGRGGDFTTAPEISQLFGEIIGVWAVDMWEKLEQPQKLHILECGAGRGTLMADLMRITRHIPQFNLAVDVHLLEISPVLKLSQEKALGEYAPTWHKSLETVPLDAPLLVIGNEFLDALPVRQFEMTGEGWRERYVVHQDGEFVLSLDVDDVPKDVVKQLDEFKMGAKIGDVLELAQARENFVGQICRMLKVNSGAALFIDYGHIKTALGDTVQAVKDHKFINILEDVGNVDITSHVDFEPLCNIVIDQGMQVFGPVEQGAFLYGLGIEQRVQALLSQADERQALDIKSGLSRLTAPDQMGKLFKVMGITP